MADITLVNHLKSLSPAAKPAAQKSASGMAEAFQKTLEQVNQIQNKADNSVEKFQSGQGGNLHEVMLNMEQADISMRLLVQMRNKVVEAYQEVMRMQV